MVVCPGGRWEEVLEVGTDPVGEGPFCVLVGLGAGVRAGVGVNWGGGFSGGSGDNFRDVDVDGGGTAALPGVDRLVSALGGGSVEVAVLVAREPEESGAALVLLEPLQALASTSVASTSVDLRSFDIRSLDVTGAAATAGDRADNLTLTFSQSVRDLPPDGAQLPNCRRLELGFVSIPNRRPCRSGSTTSRTDFNDRSARRCDPAVNPTCSNS